MKPGTALLALMLVAATLQARPQQAAAKLEGMWSDPPATAEGTFCFFACTAQGIDRLNKLLDDPANDARPSPDLIGEAKKAEGEYIKSILTPEGLKHYPLDPLKEDPGYTRCEPWGLARQMFAPHQLEIRARGKDRIELRYGEWTARRTVYVDGRKIPEDTKATPLGYSIGRWEGDTLVVETSHVQANIFGVAADATLHSDQLKTIERFSRAADGKTLVMTATLEDPATFRTPVVFKKIWGWAPDQKISPYDSCERPSDLKGTKR